MGISVKLRLPSISYVVARSWPDAVIGRDNRLPWHLRSDFNRFRTITWGHVIIMGRKTYESIGKPLPKRISLVLSREPISDTRNSFWNLTETAVLWVENRETAIFYADIITISQGQQEFFVIGGAQMYEIFKDLFNKIYITEVLTGDSPNGDAHFNFIFDQRKWKTLREESVPAGPHDDYPSKFSVLERKMKTVRYVELPDYYTETEVRQRWVARQMEFIKSPRTAMPRKHQYRLELEPA